VSELRHLVFESFIAASPERVFAFHERRDAFAVLTPWWSGARVVRMAPSLRPGERALLVLGRGPLSVEWEAVHEVYEPPKCFVESQVRGPFRSWRHRHLVLPEGDGAWLRDELEYALPGGSLEPVLNLALRTFLGRLFAYRHRITRQMVLTPSLVRGRAALPARGMRALPEALAHSLRPGVVSLNTPVRKLMFDTAARVLGVRTPDAELRGSAVVLATDGDTTARLTGLDVPRVELGSATPYLAGQQRLHVDLAPWRTLGVVRTPRSQFQQPPHVGSKLPSTRTRWPGLYLAGEVTEDSSLNGAMRSGEAAARAVANDLRAHLLGSAAIQEESRT
jgi:ligand-binding SRPBCC domain-containing protein